jgi:uncharacterized protein (DUF58 family)
MNSRVQLLTYLAYGLLILGLGLLHSGVMVLAVPLLVYLALAIYYSTPEPELLCERRLDQATMRAGGLTAVTLTIANQGPPIEELLVEDQLPAGLTVWEGPARLLAPLPPGKTLTLNYTIRSTRGNFLLPGIQVEAGETLGLFRQARSYALPNQLAVIPAYRRLHSVTVRALRTLGFTGPLPSRQAGAGVDFFGVRPYQSGDPFRRVNWRAMARHGDVPYTTEFEQERITDIGLIVDMREQTLLSFGAESLLEYAVEATAALADTLLREGHRLGLLLYGQVQWIFPGYGKKQRERVLRALAAAAPSDSQVFRSLNYLPTRLLPARSQIIFVSSLLPGDEVMLLRLRAYGYAVMVVSPDPIHFEAGHLPANRLLPLARSLAQLERQFCLRRLRQGGITLINWPVERSLDEVVQAGIAHAPPGRMLRVLR